VKRWGQENERKSIPLGKAVITTAIRLRYDYDTTTIRGIGYKPISQLRFNCETTTIRRYHDAFDYTTEVIEITICVRFDCDTTTIRLRRIARLFPFDAIRREQKMNMSIFRRSHVVVVSQSNRTQIVISINSVVVECIVVSSYLVVSSYHSRIVVESQLYYRL